MSTEPPSPPAGQTEVGEQEGTGRALPKSPPQMAEPPEAVVEEDEEPAAGFLIFQCLQCRHILGDSKGMVNVDEEKRVLLMSAVTHHVAVCDELKFCSERGTVEQGSAYFDVVCNECELPLGRKYYSTSRGLDHYRDTFALDAQAMQSYTLGSAVQSALDAGGGEAPTAGEGGSTQNAEVDNTVRASLPPLAKIVTKLTMLSDSNEMIVHTLEELSDAVAQLYKAANLPVA